MLIRAAALLSYGVKSYTSHLLSEHPLSHAFFTRQGGVSDAPYDTLNLGDGVGDREENVAKNRACVCKLLGFDQLAYATQVHGIEGIAVGPGVEGNVGCADALIVATPGQGIMVKHADCQPTLIYSPKRHVAAAIHCGWRSQVQNIYAHTIKRLKEEFRCRPQDLLVAIGPSLGPEHAEFRNWREDFPPMFAEHGQGDHFNLIEIGVRQFEEAGVLPHHIECSGLCTYSNPNDFFSYRREKVTGRNGSLIGLSTCG